MDTEFRRMEDIVMISAVEFQSKSQIRASKLSELWNIGLEMAKRTLKATTQHSLRQLGREYPKESQN